jgi:ribulose 1,5-bisphosphate carboxylase large subunit-like protein
MAKVVTSDYAPMLLNGGDNFTATYFAEVMGTVSPDTIGRSIASEISIGSWTTGSMTNETMTRRKQTMLGR